VDYSTADNTALAGSDYSSSSGTVTFAPSITTRTILVPTIDDTAEELTESFFVNLSASTGEAIQDNQGEATIVDDDGPPPSTKFYVVDANSRRTFEYDPSGNSLANDSWSLNLSNDPTSGPSGATANAVGTTVWVLDLEGGGLVHVYDNDGAVLGSWLAKKRIRPAHPKPEWHCHGRHGHLDCRAEICEAVQRRSIPHRR